MATIQNGDSKDKFNEGAGVLGGAAKKGAKAAGKQLKKKIEKKTGQAISKLIISGLKTLFGFFAGSIGWIFILFFCLLSILAFINLIVFNRLDLKDESELEIQANQEGINQIASDELEQAIVDRFWLDVIDADVVVQIKEYVNEEFECNVDNIVTDIRQTSRGFKVDTKTCKIDFDFTPDTKVMVKNGGAYAQAIDSAMIYLAEPEEVNNERSFDSSFSVDENWNGTIEIDERLDKPVSELTQYNSEGELEFKGSVLDVFKELTANADINKSDFLGFLNPAYKAKPQPIYEGRQVPIYAIDISNIDDTYNYNQNEKTGEKVIVGYKTEKVKVGETDPDPDGLRYKRTRPVFYISNSSQYEYETYEFYETQFPEKYTVEVLAGVDLEGRPLYKEVEKTRYLDGYKGIQHIPFGFDFTEYKEYVLEKKKDKLVGAGRCLIDQDGQEYSETCTPEEASQVVYGLVNNYIESNMAMYDIDEIYYGMFMGGVAGYSGSIGYNSDFNYYVFSGEFKKSSFGVYNEYFNHIFYLFDTNKIHGAWKGRGAGSCTTVAQAWFYDVHGINSVQWTDKGSGTGKQFAENVLINWPDKFERGYSPAPGGVLSVNNSGNGHVICIDEVDYDNDTIVITEGAYNNNGDLRIRHKMKLSDFRSQWERYSYTYANPKQ